LNRVANLFESPTLIVERFDHAEGHVHRDEGEEVTQFFALTFVEEGEFEIVQARERWGFGRSDVLLSTPGTPRAYRHPRECPDDVCLTLCFAPELMEEALGSVPGALPPRVPHGAAPRFALGRVVRALKSADPMAIESVAFDCMLSLGPHFWAGKSLPGVVAHERRIARACEAMRTNLSADQSLVSVAREAGMSSFYFARVFRELVGMTPHQYLLRARLANAARMLRGGASVTDAALLSGFNNLSHFSRMFRRYFRVAPVRYGAAKATETTE
jgi:AraC-like DNA-binding protein